MEVVEYFLCCVSASVGLSSLEKATVLLGGIYGVNEYGICRKFFSWIGMFH